MNGAQGSILISHISPGFSDEHVCIVPVRILKTAIVNAYISVFCENLSIITIKVFFARYNKANLKNGQMQYRMPASGLKRAILLFRTCMQIGGNKIWHLKHG